MSFEVAATAYDRFMGVYAAPLALAFADFAGVTATEPHQLVLDVGCGPGALAEELVRRVGAEHVAAADPSEPFVTTARERLPGVDVRRAGAEDLPFGDDAFDAVLSQLVVHFMQDPRAGLAEMGRVARPGGVVAACVWDFAGERGPLSPFWAAVRELDPGHPGESGLAGTGPGQLGELAAAAGLDDVEEGEVSATVRYTTFEDWWATYLLGVGPAGDHVAGLDRAGRERLREVCARRLPAPIEIHATAWAVRAHVPG